MVHLSHGNTKAGIRFRGVKMAAAEKPDRRQEIRSRPTVNCDRW